MPYTTRPHFRSLPSPVPRASPRDVPGFAADHEWQLFDGVPQAVIVTDVAGTIVYWNDAATALYGWNAAEACGQNILEVTPTEGTEAAASQIMERLREGKTFSGEFEVQRRDGTCFTALVTDAPVYDARGALRGVLGMSWDLTEQKQRERELREARAAAELADTQKSEFLATVSHELRTPLTAILGYQELLTSGVAGPMPPQQRQYLERIRASTHHLRELTDQILDLARVLAGGEEVWPEPVPLAHFARETVALVQPAAAAGGLELGMSGDDLDDVVLHTDPGKLRQVLLNLLSNAVKFTESGSVELHAQRDGDGVRLEVRDTGVGFPPEQAAQLFEPFRRLPNARHAHGSGLGLAIVQRLVWLLGGTIEAVGSPGQGSTFRIRLPLRAPVPPPAT